MRTALSRHEGEGDMSPRRGEHGQTVPMFAMFIVVLISFMGLVIDGGGYLLTRRNMQGNADAASLAAARELPASTSLATAAANDYSGARNAADGATVDSATYSNGNTRVKVTVSRTSTAPFASFLGMGSQTIRATSTAEVAQVTKLDGMLPFAALEGSIDTSGLPPAQIAIKVDSNSNTIGNFGAVAPFYGPPNCLGDPSGSADHRHEIEGAFYPGGLVTCGPPVGETVDVKTGNMVGPTQDGFDNRIGPGGINGDRFADTVHLDASTGRYVVDKPNSPRIGYIPVVRNSADGTATWPTGSSSSMDVIDYVMVYIGKIGEPGEPAYSMTSGNQIEVWVTPIPGMMPPSTRVDTGTAWNAASDAPIVIHLVD